MRRTMVIKLTSTETVPHWGWELGGETDREAGGVERNTPKMGHRQGWAPSDPEPIPGSGCMSQATFTATLTIGELEASFPLYCKALRILIRENRPLDQIERSLCWHRLSTLHHSLPRQYKEPRHLYLQLKRSIGL